MAERVTRTEPCGCIVTTAPGHIHTKMCAGHKRECFGNDYLVGLADRLLKSAANVNNADLIGE